jgi:hypothetical protein
MTNEEKQLLLKDLCARLSYGTEISLVDGTSGMITSIKIVPHGTFVTVYFNRDSVEDASLEDIKPYLRSLSSMTEEERGQYMDFIEWSYNDYDGTTTTCIDKERLHEYLNFIYSHHLDDNNLIERGLVLEAPEGMYK